MTEIFRRKYSEILKRAILQNPCWKISVIEFIFDKTAGLDSATLLKKNLHQEDFPLDTSLFPALLQKGIM